MDGPDTVTVFAFRGAATTAACLWSAVRPAKRRDGVTPLLPVVRSFGTGLGDGKAAGGRAVATNSGSYAELRLWSPMGICVTVPPKLLTASGLALVGAIVAIAGDMAELPMSSDAPPVVTFVTFVAVESPLFDDADGTICFN